ncbi:TPR domain-containing protein [Geopyxis carbonaria]|nr:TPR domain-containing protein [Geopyxis carbonaria]
MATASESKKRLALAVINFLETSAKDGTVASEDQESLEVATQCISDAFKVDATDAAAMADALGGQSLLSIYGVFEKMKGRGAPAAAPATPAAASGPTPSDKTRAEALKAQGNTSMQQKDFKAAITYYTKALEIIPGNPIYLSNRAAAFSNVQEFDKAIDDAQTAVDADPTYTKAWSRLGLARFAKGDARGAMEAYKAGIDAEGNGGSDIMKRGYATAKAKVEEEEGAVAGTPGEEAPRGMPGAGAGGMPDLSSLASMLGGGGGGGGMPDLGSIMSNPMFAQMAQNLMSNPGMMQNIMNNPRMKDMMEGMGGGAGGSGGSGGGLPDMGSLLADPSIAEMAKNLMGGAKPPGGADGAGPGPA